MQNALNHSDRLALKALSQRSDARGLLQFGGHMGLILLLALGAWQVKAAWGWIMALPIQFLLGVALIFLFAPAHECVHRTAFATRWINDAVAAFTGWILMLPPQYFRAFHLEHHRHTQIPGKDPELAGKAIGSVGQYLWHITGIPYWRAAVTGLITHALGRGMEPFLTGRTARSVQREAQIFLALYGLAMVVSVWIGSWALLTYWLIPVVMAQPCLRLYLLAEHGLCPMVDDMFRNTRTTLTNPVIRALAWNMPYHTEHHAFMAVPFHRLPEVHALFQDRIAEQTPGYLAFHKDYLRELRNPQSSV
ncbi:MAG: fatty acid desaturase [Alphaproteobacteria bacterium]|nr:fatty acid desaturase [Alphaproteobacteria bacterium]